MKRILIITFVLISILCFCLVQFTTMLSKNWHEINIGILSATLMGIIIEIIYLFQDSIHGYLKGKYERIVFYNNEGSRQPNDSNYKELESYRKISLELDLKYLGNKQYTGTGKYEEGVIEIHFELDSKNQYSGKGRYQYLSKFEKYKEKMPDYGELKIQVDIDFKKTKKIYIEQANILPSGITQNIEIWKMGLMKLK